METIENITTVTTQEYFGGCPLCGGSSECLNIGRIHVMVCDTHNTKWTIGENLFSSWKDETEETWRENVKRLEGYTEARPIHSAPTEEERAIIEAHKRETALYAELGAVVVSPRPIDPDDPLGFGDLEIEHVHRPDRIYFMTRDRVAYDVDRAEAEAAYDAWRAGDFTAVHHFLENQMTA